jgi:hypothetical protein
MWCLEKIVEMNKKKPLTQEVEGASLLKEALKRVEDAQKALDRAKADLARVTPKS